MSLYPRSFNALDTAYADPDASNAILVSTGIFFLNSVYHSLFMGNLNPSFISPSGEYSMHHFPSLPDLFQQRNCSYDQYVFSVIHFIPP